MINRRRFLASSSVLLAGASIGAGSNWAQAADRRMLFGYPPGAMGTDLGKGALQVLAGVGGPGYRFDNIEGRNTRLACETFKASPADGLTLLQAQSTTLCLLPNVFKTKTYDASADFMPLACIGEMSLSLTVGPAVPNSVTTLDHYVSWLADNPDYRNVGFSIYGSDGHLATLILARATGTTIKPQPYKGSLMMINDLLDKNLSAGITASGNGGLDLWTSGKLRSLGVTTAQRLSYWPNVPTLAEQGVKAMDLTTWFGWFAQGQTPSSITAPLLEKIAAMQASPAYAELHKRLLLNQPMLSPQQVTERIRKDSARYADLVATYGPAKID
ncbi:tripartite tricarboxylate transporter substrate-binding protein [Pseudomonas sp. dw_358]|uniref:tripartite tricarboxylate transporter substrate-binding protein n=1 Tax=Pseudomonas sp. dw_358 TaxID=2720083 RepID=UPI001BD3AC3C|nr:tripartite tricarboxylate transporter substrate-binding protein [Pseudomonas sp. dw_358]